MAAPIYDKEKPKEWKPPKADGSHDDLGVHPERREAETDDLEKLYNSESAPDKQPTRTEAKEKAKVAESSSEDDSSGPWNVKTDKKKRRFSLRRNQVLIGGGLTGLILGTTIAFFGFFSGPLEFLHFAKVLEWLHNTNQEELTDGRAGRLIRWARTQGTPEDRNLGAAGTRVAKHYENKLKAKGIELDYNEAGNLGAVIVDPDSEAGKKLLKGLETESGGPPPREPDGRVRLSLAERGNPDQIMSLSSRGKFMKKSVVDALDLNRLSSSIASRTLKKRAGVTFNPLKRLAATADERLRFKLADYKDRVKEQRNKQIKDGTSPDGRVSGAREDSPDDPASDGERAGAEQASAEIEDFKADATAPNADTQAKINNIKGKLGTGVGVAGFIGTMCGLKALGDASGEIQEANIVLPLIRTGRFIINTGSQIQSGVNVSMDELGAHHDDLFDPGDKTSWDSAASLQAEQGREGVGKEIPDSAKPGKDKPGFFKAVDNIMGPFSGPCEAVNSTLGGLALTVGGAAVGSSGPFGFIVTALSELAQDAALSALIDDAVRWIAGDAVDIAGAQGAELGNYANYGAFLGSNNTMQAMGGRALSSSERVALDNHRIEKTKQEMSEKSFYARIFDLREPHSLMAKTAFENTEIKSARHNVATMFSQPLKVFTKISGTFASLNGSVHAQTTPYDYGVDEFGYSLEEMESAKFNVDNPYDNAAYVEPRLEELNEYGRECFGTTVDPSSSEITFEAAPSYQQLEQRKAKCADPNNEDLVRYRFYLVDKSTMAALSCYEGIDEKSCEEIGITNASPETTEAGNANIYILGDSLTVGMKSAGLDQKLSGAGWQATSTGVSGRLISGGTQTPDGVSQAQQDSSTVSGAGTVVIGLGTNHWGQNESQFKSELEKMRTKIKELSPDTTIWWINYFGTGKFATPLANHSSTLKSFADSNNDRVIDWASVANQYISGEEVHPSDYNAMADFVVQALGPPPTTSTGGTGEGQPEGVVDISETVVTSNGGGIRVHRSIKKQVEDMISAAASDGITLTGSGYRDSSGQIAVRRNNCGTSNYDVYEKPASECSPPTARPGTSMHERGLAIDFNTAVCGSRNTPCFKWLAANADRFGFKNLPSEPWHWSTNGN